MTIPLGFRIKNYKSFKTTGAGFDCIKHINVLIGKNNIGKSSFLDALDFLCNPRTHRTDLEGEIETTIKLPQSALKSIFSMFMNGSDLEGNHWNHGKKLINVASTWKDTCASKELISIEGEWDNSIYNRIRNNPDKFPPETNNYIHIRLLADRDINPEQDSTERALSNKGVGATRITHASLHHSDQNRNLINIDLLCALNEIFNEDIVFSEITTKYHQAKDVWEIYLAEEGKELFPLSRSGSGLKTIILVLLNLLVRPSIEGQSLHRYIFSFEELENNLHPSLQRNLFSYLEKFATSTKCHIFITTHSNIAIDLYSNSPNAQINHIIQIDGEVIGYTFDGTSDGYNILQDMGVKASDILQSNGLIWIEGPSDRIYLNRFISLWSSGKLKEGAHYQFAYYGGSILANLDATIPQSKYDDALNVFRINKNVIFIGDSDRRNAGGKLKPRVKSLINSLNKTHAYHWITKAKEIENYIPAEAFSAVHSKPVNHQIGEYDFIQDHLKKLGFSKATEYRDKVGKASQYSEHFTKENLRFRPELDSVMEKICSQIRRWNHLTNA